MKGKGEKRVWLVVNLTVLGTIDITDCVAELYFYDVSTAQS
jgi:hypothetical protein